MYVYSQIEIRRRWRRDDWFLVSTQRPVMTPTSTGITPLSGTCVHTCMYSTAISLKVEASKIKKKHWN
jgi:hypothetical protein